MPDTIAATENGHAQEQSERRAALQAAQYTPPGSAEDVDAAPTDAGHESSTPPGDNPPKDDRIPVQVQNDLAKFETEVTTAIELINATSDDPVFYQRGDSIIEMVNARRAGMKGKDTPIAEVTASGFRSMLAHRCRFFTWKEMKTNDGDAIPVQAPAKVSKDILSGLFERPHALNLPELRKFTQCPIYDRNGVLHAQSGYIPEIGAYLRFPSDTPAMPCVDPHPTREQAQRAAQWLIDELLHDFLFAHECGTAGVLGLMAAPMVSEMINGPRPMIGFDAPEPGSGKTFITRVALWHVIPDMTLPNASESQEEFEKALTSQARQGRPIMAFDNLNIMADSGSLAAAITGYPTWEARQLQMSQNLTFPAPDAWVMTGNGLELSDENARRTLIIRINKHAESDTNWKHPDLREWAHENRGNVQAALATMVNAWLAAGRPAPSSWGLPSFESWAYVVGGILEHAGITGLLNNKSALANPERRAWAYFGHVMLTLQQQGYLPAEGGSASQILTAVNTAYTEEVIPERPEMVDVWTKAGELGSKLTKKRGSSLDSEHGIYLEATPGRARQVFYRAVQH